jgi:4-hydroxybenzoate polyprenyltransferase
MGAVRTIFEDFRVGRMIMLGLVTGSTAYGYGATLRQTACAFLCGAALSMAGFYVDYLADRHVDRASGRTNNPIASGSIPPSLGVAIAAAGTSASIALCLLCSPRTLLPAAGVLLVIAGLATGLLNTPILRAVSLGGLQGLFAVMGALFAPRFDASVIFVGLFLFFAMTGGRAMGDLRDLPHDEKVGTPTIPRTYGVRWSLGFLLVNEGLAYVFSLLPFAAGPLGRGYLYCALAIIAGRVLINTYLLIQPTPRRASAANTLSLVLLGNLYVLGMILGRP